jgi:hypothetical protein
MKYQDAISLLKQFRNTHGRYVNKKERKFITIDRVIVAPKSFPNVPQDLAKSIFLGESDIFSLVGCDDYDLYFFESSELDETFNIFTPYYDFVDNYLPA